MRELNQYISEKLQISRNKKVETDKTWENIIKHKFWQTKSRFYPSSMLGREIFVTNPDVDTDLQDKTVGYITVKNYGTSAAFLEVAIPIHDKKTYTYLPMEADIEFTELFNKTDLLDILDALNDLS
jgi:hypothetical protein